MDIRNYFNMVGTKSVIEMGNSSAEEFVNIKKNIFQSNTGINDRNVPPEECMNDRYSDTKIKSKLDECISDSYQFVGSSSFCKLCDFRPNWRTPSILEAHMRSHTGDKPFSCSVCDFSTVSKYYLETHMRKHTGEKPFHCPECEFSTSRKNTLKLHLLTHTKEKPFACTECNFRCVRKKGLLQHWSFHCKFKHFRCSVCDYKCRKSSELRDHVLSHPAVMSCLWCDYMGRCIEDIEKHNLTHTKRKADRCICSKCGVSLSDKKTLRKHILRNTCT